MKQGALIGAAMAATLISSFAAPAFAQPDASSEAAIAGPRGPLEIVVWNIRKGLGHVRVSICTRLTFGDSRKHCPYHGEAEVRGGATIATIIVPELPAGNYAAEVFQDEDDSKALKRGPLGIPLEGVGFSNDAPVNLRPPRFNDAAFDYDPAAPMALRIKLRYFPNL